MRSSRTPLRAIRRLAAQQNCTPLDHLVVRFLFGQHDDVGADFEHPWSSINSHDQLAAPRFAAKGRINERLEIS